MVHVWKTNSTAVVVAARANVGNEYLSCGAKPHLHAGPLQAGGWSLDNCLRLPSNGPVRVERSYPEHHRPMGLIGPIATDIEHMGSVGYDRWVFALTTPRLYVVQGGPSNSASYPPAGHRPRGHGRQERALSDRRRRGRTM